MSQFYVRLGDGRELRRTILESSKGAIHILRGYQDIVRVRGEKVEAIDRLRREMRELTVLVNRLDTLLPKFGDAEMAMIKPDLLPPPPAAPGRSGKAGKKGAKKGKTAPASAPARTKGPVEDVHERLSRIERQLGEL